MKQVLTAFLFIMTIYLIIIASGCSVLQKPKPDADLPAAYNPGQEIVKVIRTTNWYASLCIGGMVLGVFAGLNGCKWGWSAVAACAFGLYMSIATARYAQAMAITGLVGSLLLSLVSILTRWKALKEIIAGVQEYRDNKGAGVKIDDALGNNQSYTTQKLVKKIKDKLKLNGRI